MAANGPDPDRDDLYRRLQKQLDRMPVGFPAAPSGVELRILRRLFTEADARIAVELSLIPEPAGRIARRLSARPAVDALRAALDDMDERGLVLRLGRGARARYGMLPFVVGIYERQLPRLTPELEADVLAYFAESFGRAVHTHGTPPMRTVPVHLDLAPSPDVVTYDDIRAHVRAHPGPFAAMPCICREGKALVGEPCRQTKRTNTCLTFGDAAAHTARTSGARTISREEMLSLLDEADTDGLVLQPENTRNPMFVCCCCGCCCGVLTSAKRLPEPATFFGTNYVAVANAEACGGCGTCLTRCQMDAIEIPMGQAIVSESHCIGCGLCVPTCPEGALALRPLQRQRVPPANTAALYARMYRERHGALGLATAVGRRLLGLKS